MSRPTETPQTETRFFDWEGTPCRIRPNNAVPERQRADGSWTTIQELARFYHEAFEITPEVAHQAGDNARFLARSGMGEPNMDVAAAKWLRTHGCVGQIGLEVAFLRGWRARPVGNRMQALEADRRMHQALAESVDGSLLNLTDMNQAERDEVIDSLFGLTPLGQVPITGKKGRRVKKREDN